MNLDLPSILIPPIKEEISDMCKIRNSLQVVQEPEDSQGTLIDLSGIPPSEYHTIRGLATMANESAVQDLHLFLFSLQIWNTHLPDIYIFCTTSVKNLELDRIYKGKLYYNTGLDQYQNLTRQEMEQIPSRQGLSNLFHDFTMEKCNLFEWVFRERNEHYPYHGVVFCDSDLCWTAPLPQVDHRSFMGLSRHEIHSFYEEKYGIYNAGLIWFRGKQSVDKWREECKKSRFFEQAALETISGPCAPWQIYQFPIQVNYGWWRMFQGTQSSKEQQAKWTLKRDLEGKHSGILVDGKPLICIHTHFDTTDTITKEFNIFFLNKLAIVRKQKKVSKLLKEIVHIFTSSYLHQYT